MTEQGLFQSGEQRCTLLAQGREVAADARNQCPVLLAKRLTQNHVPRKQNWAMRCSPVPSASVPTLKEPAAHSMMCTIQLKSCA